MKDTDLPGNGGEDFDPDLEARLVAMIAGEASEFEVEALERLMEARPEVGALKRRLELMDDLVDFSVKRDDVEWKLSPERRAHVMETLGIGRGGDGDHAVTEEAGTNNDAKEARIRRAGRKVLWAAAACVMINVILFGWFVGTMTKRSASKQESEAMMVRRDGSSSMPLAGKLMREEAKESEATGARNRKGKVPPPAPSAKPSAGGGTPLTASRGTAKKKSAGPVMSAEPGTPAPGENRSRNALAELRESLGSVDDSSESAPVGGDDPAPADPFGGEPDAGLEAPRAAPRRALIARTPRAAEPIAGITKNDVGGFIYPTESDAPGGGSEGVPLDLEDEAGGIGWGSGGAGGGGGFAGGAKKDGDVTRGDRTKESKTPGFLPPQPADGGLATAPEQPQSGLERAARERVGGDLKLGPGEADGDRDPDVAGDPIRTASALEFERREDLAKVQESLAQAEGFKDLGLYDDAIKDYEAALRTDPQSPAARQGLESIDKLKSEHRRASYDEARADLLKQVDQAWEMAVPPPDESVVPGRSNGRDGRRFAESADIVTRTWKVGPKFLEDLASADSEGEEEADPFSSDGGELAGGALKSRKPTVEVFKEIGIEFPPGATVEFDPATGTLIVKNTPENLELVDMLSEKLSVERAEQERLEEVKRALEESPEINAGKEPFSTFSLHVSDVSFKLAKASLAKGEWPAPGQMRVEEFVNAFDYGDPAPSQDEKVACRVEQAAHPFMLQRNLLRISMRTAAVGRSGGTPLSLTVLLDHSGSMERMDRAESVQRAFDLLASQLNQHDQVTLVSFARTPRLLADRIPGNQAGSLSAVVATTPTGGGTNLEEALRVGLAKAMDQKIEGAQNRIILLTDGAANLGNSKAEDLAQLVEAMRQQEIAFDACGVGAEGLNDEILESLTRKGDGRYYFLDRPEDADAGFAKQIAGALRPAAKNVKVQVQFNPRRVGRYKLFGFDKHRLKTEDFRNDSVDAAEMAAAEAGNAIYQVEVLPAGEGAIGSVSVRFQDMATRQMVERRWVIPYDEATPRLAEATPSMRLAGSAAFLGEKLDGSALGDRVRLNELTEIVNSLRTAYPASARVGELIEMTAKARELGE